MLHSSRTINRPRFAPELSEVEAAYQIPGADAKALKGPTLAIRLHLSHEVGHRLPEHPYKQPLKAPLEQIKCLN